MIILQILAIIRAQELPYCDKLVVQPRSNLKDTRHQEVQKKKKK